MNAIVNFLFYSVRAGTPLLLGTTGEIISRITDVTTIREMIDKFIDILTA